MTAAIVLTAVFFAIAVYVAAVWPTKTKAAPRADEWDA